MLDGLQTSLASVHSFQDPPEMNLIEDIEVVCPYCGSSFVIEADTAAGSYRTTEDCSVCCRPIALYVRCRPGEVETLEVQRE